MSPTLRRPQAKRLPTPFSSLSLYRPSVTALGSAQGPSEKTPDPFSFLFLSATPFLSAPFLSQGSEFVWNPSCSSLGPFLWEPQEAIPGATRPFFPRSH